MKTFYLKKEDVKPKWYLVDATDQVVGRLAGHISRVLKGKNDPKFTPGVDSGVNVVVINCEKVKLSGKKPLYKKYYTHSFYLGGLKETSYQHMLEKSPELILKNAIKGMLARNKLRDRLMARLRIYQGEAHPHDAQKPESLTFS